jgi:hypothetical protein
MWEAMSTYTMGGEEAVKATSAPTLLLEQLNQAPMSVIETRERVKVDEQF